MQHRRTNNNAEDYHSHLKVQIASNNPNLIKFFLSLHMEADIIVMTSKLLS